MDKIKKADGLAEDEAKMWEAEVQDMTNAYIKKIDQALEDKQGEIMQV